MKWGFKYYVDNFANEIYGRYYAKATLDSGSSIHLTGIYCLTNIKKTKTKFEATFSEVVSEYSGDLKIGDWFFENVSYLPSIVRETILSLSAITERGYQVRLDKKGGEITKDGINVASFPKIGGKWALRASDATKKLTFKDPLECCKSVEKKKTKVEGPVATGCDLDTNTRDFWLVDTGACRHIVNDERKLMNKSKWHIDVRDVSGRWTVVNVVGDVQFGAILLKNVLFIPNATVNLISVHELVEEGYEFHFNKENVVFVRNEKEVYSVPSFERVWGVSI